MLKHRQLMYNKNVKKTFEILCIEITFIMDLYMNQIVSYSYISILSCNRK